MLRRKLLILLGSLVALLLIVSVLAIWLLQGVLSDLDHTGKADAIVAEDINQMGATITTIEIELREVQLRQERHLDDLIDSVEQLRACAARVGERFATPLPEGRPLYQNVTQQLPRFERHVGMLATTQDPDLAAAHTAEALRASVSLRKDILALGKLMHAHMAREQEEAMAWFRWVVLALGIVFLVVINLVVMVLLHMANMILRPVDKLVEASRRLAAEEFGHRVEVAQDDEFGELARAYNHLAESLQRHEREKLETLAQAAVTLNHELNNASAIIKLQLQLLERSAASLGGGAGGNPALEKCLRQIHESLARMTATVEALKHVRRIVLADYSGDTKMLDLQRSVAPEEVEPAVHS